MPLSCAFAVPWEKIEQTMPQTRLTTQSCAGPNSLTCRMEDHVAGLAVRIDI